MQTRQYSQTIALLGGSFNPAHEGHVHISEEVLKRTKCDKVWWLVSPHNPLKNKNSLAVYERRFAYAKQLVSHPDIIVSDFEQRHQLGYTIDTIRRIKLQYPQYRFVWLMGADNLAGFHRWKMWRDIAREVEIIVVDRRPMSYRAVRSKAATVLKSLTYLFIRPHPQSATHLRKTLGKSAFLHHNAQEDV